MSFNYDFAIVGAGASGLIAADFAVKLGARVVMLEKERIGGDCTWSGCVPSKSLIKAASVAHTVRESVHEAGRFGVGAQAMQTGMPQVRAWLDSTIAHIYAPTTPEALRAKGMDVLLGQAAFLDPHTLRVGERRITAGKFLVNTGAHPALPNIPGLNAVPYFTYKQIFANDRLPRRLIVIGGGPVGCEIAQSYRRLGAEVTLIAERLLPHEEPEAGAMLAEVFAAEGVGWMRGRATGVTAQGDTLTVATAHGQVTGDMLLVAAGRSPSVEGLGLENAGVRYSSTGTGISVDAHLRTSARHIYAAGDVIGGPQYSHLAGWQGFQAARNALLPGKSAGTPRAMPRVTFTSPEVAQVGLTESEARTKYGKKYGKLQVKTLDLARVDRAVNEDDRHGLLKLIALANGEIVGGSIVGERAGEAITEVVIAIDRGIKVQQLAGVVHPYPSYAIGFQFLATEMAMERTFTRRRGRLLRLLSRMYR